ncbi:MAG: DUF6701 domain-containing protein [Pseudomonas sp.]|uniref:DUF6701 domain-containing protein n=1 Tax=Pseudomonas sp. TaxID=306 RepID=UPI003BB5B64B
MRAVWLVSLALFSAWVQAAIGISSANFPDGLQSPYSGTASSKGVIDFGYNAQLLNNPDTVLAAKTVNRNGGSTLNTCSSAHCTASGTAAPTQDAGPFPFTGGYTATVNVGYQVNTSLTGNGTNQYKTINLGYQAQLTINSAGQSFYIDQLTLDSESVLRLAPGDYWVRALTTGYQSQIQVQGSGLVRLFVRDDWSLASSSLLNSPAINSAGTPGKLYVYSYGSVTLNNQATLSGYVYSANSNGSNDAIALQSPSYVFGALSGENISLATDARVNYSPTITPLSCLSDNFNRTSGLGSDWVARGSGYTPAIVGNRLRLTPASGNVATMLNLQRLLPAAGNLIQVQFHLYAYGGNGADGVALVLSDALITPQPGAFGGPLGYGTKGGANVGFAGGWLGVGLDEYGNFSNEGGPNSVGQRPDSVAVRGSGSGTNGYGYIAGTAANLSPGIDVSGSTAGPGHLYRITVDGRSSGQVLLTVERDTTGSGNSLVVLPNLNGINVRAATGQVVEPANFFLSLTGSTGGSTNIHEIDDLQLCALQINPVGQQIDHFELTHANNALTCTPLPVTVKACLDSAVPCTTPYTGTSPALSASLSPATWSGLNFSNGVASAQLAVRAAGTVRMNVDSSTPALKAFAQTQCKSGSSAWGTGAACDVAFADSGFIFDVPTLLARKPQSNISLQAVRKNPITQTCDPAFSSGTRDVLFTRSYTSPTTNPYSASADVLVNDQVLAAAGSNVSLTFGSNATALLKVQYNDAGQMILTARYAPTSGTESGLVMTYSDLFVSKPYGLLLETDTDSGCTADINCLLYKEGTPKTERRAGDPFSLRIKAVAWQCVGTPCVDEPLTAAALADNLATPNFQLSSIALSSQVQAPVGGSNGILGLTSYSHVLGTQTTLTNQTISEVGVFKLTATPAASAYFGETVSGGSSGLVGRFAPAYLGASGSASLTPSCVNPNPLKSFSYQGQPMAFASGQEPNLSVTGKNRAGGTTGNYDRGSFWRLATPVRDAYLSVTGKATLDVAGRLLSAGSASLAQSGADNGDGARTTRWSGETLAYSPALVPVTDDLPFTAAVRQGFSAAALTDADGACYLNGQASCQAFSFDFTSLIGSLVTPGSEVRLGRLRIGNAHGSELQSLTLPVTLESWQNVASGSFQKEVLDTCTTAPVLGALALDSYTSNLTAGETAPTSTAPALGVGSVLLGAPGSGNDGSVQLRYPSMPSWLYFAWDGVTRSEARGLASFGIYKGATPLIFRRELYR